MGMPRNTARGLGAYALTGRAAWIAFGNRGDHGILVEGDRRHGEQLFFPNAAKRDAGS